MIYRRYSVFNNIKMVKIPIPISHYQNFEIGNLNRWLDLNSTKTIVKKSTTIIIYPNIWFWNYDPFVNIPIRFEIYGHVAYKRAEGKRLKTLVSFLATVTFLGNMSYNYDKGSTFPRTFPL